jgi:hypothetical protein
MSAGVDDPQAAAATANVTAARHRYHPLLRTLVFNPALLSRIPDCTMRPVPRHFRLPPSRSALRRASLSFIAVALAASVVSSAAQSTSSAGRSLIARAAEALGGRDRILAIKTLTIEGYGQLAYQNGGGNITSSTDAPQKWIDINDFVRVVDFENSRARLRQRLVNDFVFAAAQNMKGVVTTQGVDGDIAYNVSPAGAATRASSAVAHQRRSETFAHPVVIVRLAMHPKSTVSNRRKSGAVELVDVTSPLGNRLTLAVDAASALPAWVSWVGPDGNLGDVTYRAAFTGYQPVGGVLMPTGINTTIDFRSIVQQKLYVDRHAIDAQIGDLAAPAAVRNGPAPVPQAPTIEATSIAKGIWFLRGAGNSVLFEFQRSPDAVRGLRQRGERQGGNRKGTLARARQAAHRSHRIAPSFRPHRRFTRSGSRRADDHHAARQRGAGARGHIAAGEAVPRCARPRAEAAEVPPR